MGPRLFSRGKRHVSWAHGGYPGASMGPRLFSRGKWGGRDGLYTKLVLLQWGLGFSAEERTILKNDKCGRWLASMGPRLFSRGKMSRQPQPTRPWPASMGPRLFSRGKGSWCRHDARRRGCFNGASAFQPRKVDPLYCTRFECGWLQWGLGFSAEERSKRPSSMRFKPRPASMGPRLFSRGKDHEIVNRT